VKWLKWHIGSVNDPKFTVVARKSGQPKAVVLAVWAYLLEGAADRAGNVSGLDLEDLAAGLDVSVEAANAIWLALVEKGLIDGEVIAAWGKRQSVDVSTDRVRKYREKRNAEVTVETVSGVPETGETTDKTRLDKTREDDKEKDIGHFADRFEDFWKAYPRRKGRGQALKAWKAATKTAAPEEILAGLARAKWPTDPTFIKHPATWLNGQCWLDEPDPMSRREATLAVLGHLAGEAA